MRTALILLSFDARRAGGRGLGRRRSPTSTNGEVWVVVARRRARRSRIAAPVVNADGRDREVAGGRGVRQRPHRRRPQRARPEDLELLVVQGLGAERHLDRRRAAELAPNGWVRLRLSRSASTSPPTARTWSTASRTAAGAARSTSAAAPTSGRSPTARSTRSVISGYEEPTLFGIARDRALRAR